MTNLQYITSQLERFGLTETDMTAILIAQGLTPGDTANVPEVKQAIYGEIPLLIAGLQDVSESGYSIKWNIPGIKAWYTILAKELGKEDLLTPKPTLTYCGNRW